MATERLLIEITETGARVVKREIDGIAQASAVAAGQQKKLQGAMAGTAATAGVLKQSLAILGIGSLAIGVRAAVSSLINFEQSMADVKAVSGATEQEFRALRETATALGRDTRFTASQAADGMTLLARAGFTAGQTLATVDDVLRLAQVGSLDMATAANIATSALAGFRLEVSQAGRVTDVLAKAANASNTSVEQMGDALKFAAPVAAGLGVSLEEAAAAAGILSNSGLQASIAGTGLRRVLSELESPTTKTIRILNQLGLTAKDVSVSGNGLTNAIQKLSEAGADTALALEIFGDRGGPAFEVLASGLPKVRELTETLRAAGGSAEKTARIMDDNLKGSVLRALSAAENLVIKLGDIGGTAALRRVLDGLADGFRLVAEFADVALAALAGFAVGGPIGAGIAALGVTFVRLSDDIKLTSDGVVTLQTVFLQVLKTIATELDKVVGFVQGALAAVMVSFSRLPGAIVDDFLVLINKIIGVINAFVRKVQLTINELITELNRVSAQAGEAFFGAGEGFDLGPVALGQIEALKNPFAGESEELGRIASDAFAAGFRKAGAAEAVQELIDATALGPAVVKAATGPVSAPTEAGEGLSTGIAEALAARKAFADLNAEIDRQTSLLGKNAQEREVSNQLAEIENGLKSQGIDLTTQENQALLANVETRIRLLEVERRRAEVLEEIRGPQEAAIETQRILNELLAAGKITTDEHVEATRKLTAETVRGTSAWDGFVDAIERVDVSARALGDAIAGALLGAIDRASDALADFALSGFRDVEALKEAFSDLFADLAKQILKIIIQTLILKAIQGALGGAGGGVGSAIGAAVGGAGSEAALSQRQAGGPVGRGQPVIVGEKRPEIFVPTSSGRVEPSVGPPVVNVSVVNVTDPDEVTGVINSAAGEEVVLNVLSRNRNRLKSLVS